MRHHMNTTLQHIARDLVVLNRNLLKLVATERPRTKQTAIKRVATTHKRRARRTAPVTSRLVVTQPKRSVSYKPKGRGTLTPADKKAIRTLLEAGTIPVTTIAGLYRKSTAHIYALNKAWNLKGHQASPALMSGIRRLKAQRAKEAREQEAARSAPTKLVDQPEVTPTQTPTQAVPQAIPEPVPMAARPVEV